MGNRIFDGWDGGLHIPTSAPEKLNNVSTSICSEDFAAVLEASGNYKVLRRIDIAFTEKLIARPGERLAVTIDVETTGIEKDAELIELAFVPFLYTTNGDITRVGIPFRILQEPSKPIPPHITLLTGLTNADVLGQQIDKALLTSAIEPAALLIAHNAAFDRLYCERLLPLFEQKPWGCSMQEIDWTLLGVEGRKLSYIAAHYGFFYDKHRAEGDALALVEVLRQKANDHGTVLSLLLANARQTTCRIFADGAPFALKGELRARHYRWSDGTDGQPKAWYRDVLERDLESELDWLRSEILGFDADPLIKRLTAYERYSTRG